MPANTYLDMQQTIADHESAASNPQLVNYLLSIYGWTPEAYAAAGNAPAPGLPPGFTPGWLEQSTGDVTGDNGATHGGGGPSGQAYFKDGNPYVYSTINAAGSVPFQGAYLTPYSESKTPDDFLSQWGPLVLPAAALGGAAFAGAGAAGGGLAEGVAGSMAAEDAALGASMAGSGAAGAGAAAGGAGVGDFVFDPITGDVVLPGGTPLGAGDLNAGGLLGSDSGVYGVTNPAAGGLPNMPPGLQQIANALRSVLGGQAAGTGAGGAGTGGGSNLTGLANLLAGLYTLTSRSQVDPTKMNALWQAGQDTYNMARDPNNALRDTMRTQAQDTSRAATSARGFGMSPVAAGMETDALRNFDMNWQNNLLQRQLSGLGGLSEATGGYFGQANADRAFGANQNASGMNALLTGANVLGQPGNWLSTMADPAFGASAGAAYGGGTAWNANPAAMQPRAQFDAWGGTAWPTGTA